MIVEQSIPTWTSSQWGSRGGWGLLVIGGLTIAVALVGLGAVWWAVATQDPVELGAGLLVAVLVLALLVWAVPAALLGWRLRRPPLVDAGDVAFVVHDPALLTAPMVIPWAEVDRVEHLRELDRWGSPEGLNCSFTGLTGWLRPRFPNLLVRVVEPRTVPEARAGWLGPWPLSALEVPSPYLMPRPSRTHTTRGFLVVVADPEAVIATFAAASDGSRPRAT